jgi:hypothetical protein
VRARLAVVEIRQRALLVRAACGARANPAFLTFLTAASGTFRMIDRRRGLRNVPVAARRSARRRPR